MSRTAWFSFGIAALAFGVYAFYRGFTGELIPGGLASGRKAEDFDPVQLRDGIREEMEHTTDRRVAREIAMDHLAEDPDYYRKLAKLFH